MRDVNVMVTLIYLKFNVCILIQKDEPIVEFYWESV